MTIYHKMNDSAEQFLIDVTCCYMPYICLHVWQKMKTSPSVSILYKKMSTNN